MKLSKKLLDALKPEETRMKIGLDCGVVFSTLSRWINTNHPNLTRRNVINAIAKNTGIKESQMFEKETQLA